MKHPRFAASLFFLLIFLPCMVYAQWDAAYDLSFGKAYLFSTRTDLVGWGDGWTAALGMSLNIHSNIELTANESYSQFPFSANRALELMHLFWPVSGSPAEMYRTAIGVRTFSSGRVLRAYLSLESGLAWLHRGQITYPAMDYRAVDFIGSPVMLHRFGSTEIESFGSVGVGMFIPVTSHFAMRLEGKWLDTWTNGDSYFPVTSSIVYQP